MRTFPSPQGFATTLGFAGLIPFVGLAAAVVFGLRPLGIDPSFALGAYGATILSFLGGVQWGFLLSPGRTERVSALPARLALGVLPQLVGWAALLWAGQGGLMALGLAIAGHLALDLAAVRAGLAPPWFMSLRVPLSVGAAMSLISAALV